MNISKRNAAYIVQEISKIIGEKINIMNAEGIIIASSDAERIGTFHGAAKKIIEEKIQEVSVSNDDEYQGSRPGINLAITFQDKIVGVIGVTGPYQKVMKYSQIIKKMTEILILDQYYKEENDIQNRIKERYLHEWLLSNTKNLTPQFIKQGAMLQIDITVPRRVMAISIKSAEKDESSEGQHMISSSEKLAIDIISREKNNIWLKNGVELLCAVTDRSDNEMILLAEQIKKEVLEENSVEFNCGIDADCEGYALISNSVIKAKKALKTSLRSSNKEILLYTSINMEIFQSELSSNIKREYINRIFKGCSPQELGQWIELLNIFYEQEGSVTATAQKLYIHKNTLQYKLNKIKEKTGYDPRSIRYSSLFYNAIHFYQDVKDII
jgi:carbohydrate diacid regulator